MASTASSFLELQLLGAPQLRLNTQTLDHTLTGKPLALFLYLAVTGQPHTRDVLANLLWSELSIQQARNNLRYILPVLRRVMAPYVTITAQTISFNRHAPYWQDVEVLRTTLQSKLATIDTKQLETTLDLYQGEFLAGFRVRNAPAFVAWVTAQRQQLYTLTVQGLLYLAEQQLAQQHHAASQLTRQRLVALAPQATADLSVALIQAGIDVAHYHHLLPWLKAGETGEARSAGLVERLSTNLYSPTSDQPAAFPISLATLHPPDHTSEQQNSLLKRLMNSLRCHNLPSQLTPFFGRKQEMADIMAHLAKATYRLLTVTGEGGIGKTRLALAIAQSIIDCEFHEADFSTHQALPLSPALICNLQFQDGIWFVPLAHLIVTPDLTNQLAEAIAKSIQLPLNDQDTPVAQLIHYFADKRCLLILDNFEHLSTGVDFLLQLLQETTALKLLITSRQRLNIQAEYPWRLTGLPIPSLASHTNLLLATQQEYAGVALFIERARRAHPGFQLENDSIAAVIQICRFVQGLPLGIELAAALTKEYTCTEVWEILRHNYNILTTTLPDLPVRHRNIKVVLDHSWRFLSNEEATVLAGCSIFRNTFDREAAIAITGASPEIIARLIDQSLLHWTAESASRRWLNLHELVRQYAAEQLASTPELRRQVQARHASYYMRQLEEAEARLPQHGIIFQQICSNLADIRTAWLWSCETHQWSLVEQGFSGMIRMYRLAGLYHDAVQALQVAIAAIRSILPPSSAEQSHSSAEQSHSSAEQSQSCLFARLLNSAAEFYRHLGRLDDGERLAQEALAWGWRLNNIAGQSRAYQELACLAQRRGQHILMRTLAEQGVTLAQQTTFPHLTAKCLITHGAAELLCGNLTQSNYDYDAALRHLQDAPDPELEGLVHLNLGAGHLSCHNYTMARRYLTQALAINQSLNTPYKNGAIYVFSGILCTAIGAYEQARQEYQQALTIFKEVYEPYWESWGRAALAHLLKLCGNITDALLECERVLTLVQGRFPLLEHCTLTYLGDIRYQQGDWATSERLYQQAIALQQQTHLRLRLAEPTVQLAHLLLQRDEATAALALLEEPLTVLTHQGLGALAEPFTAYWVGYRALKANADQRAHALLQQAYHRLLEKATQFDDVTLRQSFLEQVATNRLLSNEAHAAGIA